MKLEVAIAACIAVTVVAQYQQREYVNADGTPFTGISSGATNGYVDPYGAAGGYNPYGAAGGYNPYGAAGGYNPYNPYGYNPYEPYGYGGKSKKHGGKSKKHGGKSAWKHMYGGKSAWKYQQPYFG